MQIITSDSGGFNAEAVLAFITSRQESLDTACAYLGNDIDDIRGDLAMLDQPWESTVRVALDDYGEIIGACLVEWDEGTGRAEIYGPWTDDLEAATALLAETTSRIPVSRFLLYAPAENEIISELAASQGFQASEPSYSMTLELDRYIPRTSEPYSDAKTTVRRANLNDGSSLAEIHETAFPQSYATTPDLLAPDGAYQTLVSVVEAGSRYRMVGYLAHQHGQYIDFISVLPEYRGCGIARRLIASMLSTATSPRVSLTADGDQSLAFWKNLGFQLVSTNISYEKRRNASSNGSTAAARPVIRGSKVTLVPALLDDCLEIYEWCFHSETTRFHSGLPDFPQNPIPSFEEFREEYADFNFTGDKPLEGRGFIIKRGSRRIGFISYTGFHLKPGIAELDLWLPKLADCGHGYGTDALTALANYLHETLGFTTLIIAPATKNSVAVRSYEKAGFTKTTEPMTYFLLPQYVAKYGGGDYGENETVILVKATAGTIDTAAGVAEQWLIGLRGQIS